MHKINFFYYKISYIAISRNFNKGWTVFRLCWLLCGCGVMAGRARFWI